MISFHRMTTGLRVPLAIAAAVALMISQGRPLMGGDGMPSKTNLPKADYRGLTLEEAVEKRRSVREFTKQPLSLKELSQLLFAAAGRTGSVHGFGLRAAPSAGALYPIDVYVLVSSVEGLEPGIYRYSTEEHALERLKSGLFAQQAQKESLGQEAVGGSAATFILAAVFERCRVKYGDRALRYIYIEAGHISENIYLQAASLGLGSVAVGAFSDQGWNRLLGLDGEKESVVYMHPVGKVKQPAP
ncbi:MAG: SagB/ThcOx family dehydrogenase [Elusimicrobia bacterium]|nr:SagB/ThcOx family dehydrogenase [Elusimicrobiota bacterium]